MRKSTWSGLFAAPLLLASALSSGCGAGGSADNKFRPNPNGFSFANNFMTGAPAPGPAMTADEVRRFFGDQVCGSMMGGCALTPPAQEWLNTQNKSLYDGLCEGFAVLSNLLYIGANGMKASDFQAGASAAFDLNVADNGKLQRELAYWFTSQTLITRPPMLTPAELGMQLMDALSMPPSAGLPTIAFFKKGFKDGHAMNAYAINQTGDGYSVKVYDNNYPNMERTLEINTKADTWTYNGATTADTQRDLYIGDSASKTIGLVPTSLRLAKFSCPFCGDMTPGTVASGTRELRLNSLGGHLIISDTSGRAMQYDGSNIVNNIPGGEVVPLLPGTLGRPDIEPLYRVPGGSDLTVTLDGTALTAASQSTVSLIGPGYTLDVEDVNLNPGQKDTIGFPAAGNKLVYTTQQSETPNLVLGIQTAGNDYRFEVKVTGDTNGQTITLTLDQTGGKLQLQVDGHDTADYDIDLIMHRIGKNGDESFSHVGDQAINIPSGGSVAIAYGAWTGQGDMIALQVDNDRNGTIDNTVMLTDQL